jgi:hypothetical protein
MVTVLSIKVAIHEALRDHADIAPPPRPRSRAGRRRSPPRAARAALDAHLFEEQDETGVLVRQG